MTIFALVLGSFFAALTSGITGMAGGVLLISVLNIFYDASTSIALHGVLQVIANFSRILLFVKSVSWKPFFYFISLVIPGAWLGAQLIQYISEGILETLLGLVILWVVVQKKKSAQNQPKRPLVFIPLGFTSGFLGMIIGVTGPLLAPFFIRAGITKERFIATKSLCQFVVQLTKVFFFATLLQFSYADESTNILWMALGLVLGTLTAKMLLPYIKENIFVYVLKGLLLLISLQLIVGNLAPYFWR